MTNRYLVAQIASMLETGMSVEEVTNEIDEANRDARDAMEYDDSAFGDEYRFSRSTGCNADDTTDSRGCALRPKVNDAGEPYWM